MFYKKFIMLLLSLGLTACFYSANDDDHSLDGSEGGTQNTVQVKGKIEGEVVTIGDSGFSINTANGEQIDVVINSNAVLVDGNDVAVNVTDIVVGDNVEVQGSFDENSMVVNAIKIALNNDPADDNETMMVVGAGLGAPTVDLDVSNEQQADSHVEVNGVVASVAGNAIVINVTEVEHSTADLGTQLTVMLSGDFIKLGAMADIAVGDLVELNGVLDTNNSFVIQVMKVNAPIVNTAADDSDNSNGVDATSGSSNDTNGGSADDADVDSDSANGSSDTNADDSSDDSSNGASSDGTVDLLEVRATVVSYSANVLTVSTIASGDHSIATDTQLVIDTTNVQTLGADLAGLVAGDVVELKGGSDSSGNFVVTAVEIYSSSVSGHDHMGTSLESKIIGTVTSISNDAISVTVTSVRNLSDVVIDSDITINITAGTRFDDNVMPQVGDAVEINMAVVPGGSRVASEIGVRI